MYRQGQDPVLLTVHQSLLTELVNKCKNRSLLEVRKLIRNLRDSADLVAEQVNSP